MGMHKTECGIATLDVSGNDTQGADVKHLLETKGLAAHLLDDAVNVFGAALHQSGYALLVQVALQLRTQRLHEAFAQGPLFVKLTRHLLVDIRLQKAERQVFHFPLELPDAQPVGQRRKHMQRLVRQRWGRRLFAGGIVPQRLQARGQPQHHHAQVA